MTRFAPLARAAAVVSLALGAAQPAMALDWMDNSIGYRFGTKFAEPYNPEDIRKSVINLTHASGYQFGSNYMNLDILKSDRKDDRATETYRRHARPGLHCGLRLEPQERQGLRLAQANAGDGADADG